MAKEISAKNRIAIIGSGHIGSALAEGLTRSGIRAHQITVSGPSVLRNSRLQKLGVQMTHDNVTAVRSAHWIFLAVKPATVSEVLKEIALAVKGKVVVSLCAGVKVTTLKKYANHSRIARIMPNIPIATNKGVIGYFSSDLAKKEKKQLWSLLSGTGVIIEVKSERDLNIITILSGCGPGIVAFLISTLAKNGKMLGLSEKTANLLALETFNGTLAYLTYANISPEKLIKSVATKGGATEAILTDFAKSGFVKDFARAIGTGYARIKKLNK